MKGLSGVRQAAGNLILLAVWQVVLALLILFMLFLLRILARRDWLAVILFVLVFVTVNYSTGSWLSE